MHKRKLLHCNLNYWNVDLARKTSDCYDVLLTDYLADETADC